MLSRQAHHHRGTLAGQFVRGTTSLVATVKPATVASLEVLGVELENAAVWVRDQDLAHALRDSKLDRGAALPVQTWRDLPLLLAEATVYLDTENQALLYPESVASARNARTLRVNPR